MRRWLVGMLFVAGCSGGNKLAGTYRASSGPELILNSDGSFRYLIGERTSGQDVSGNYTVSGNEVTFIGASRFSKAAIDADGLAIELPNGKIWQFDRK